MDNRTLVKISATKNCIGFRIVTPTEKSPHRFYVLRDSILALEAKSQVIEQDCGSFAVLRRDKARGTLSIRFVWLSGSGCQITGREETVTLPYDKLLEFMNDSATENGPKEWNTLSIEASGTPRQIFCGQENLHDALRRKAVRRKLVRFLRDHFQWGSSDEIRFYNDFVSYSVSFREFRCGQPGMSGGLILHGQEDMAKAQYSIHT